MQRVRFGATILGIAMAGSSLTTMPALAADIARPVYKAPVAAPVHSWTGFYLGGGIGYGTFTNAVQTFENGAQFASPDSTAGQGWLATVIAGFDYQFSDRWVAGVFADVDLSNIEGLHSRADIFPVAGDMKQKSAWAAGARLGYLLAPGTLLYVTGGYTQAHFSDVLLLSLRQSPHSALPDATYTGWFAGLGSETNLAGNWYARLEYRYADYGSEHLTFSSLTSTPQPLRSISLQPSMQTMRAALTYRYGDSARAPASIAGWGPQIQSNWTGFYFGGGAGYGAYALQTQMVFSLLGSVFEQNQNNGGKGWLGTAIAGVDYQFASRWVAGIFADYDWAAAEGQYNAPIIGLISANAASLKQSSAWAIGGRFGYLASPSTLYYLTAGYSQAKFNGFVIVDGGNTIEQAATSFDGWLAGAGIETQLNSNWAARLEYRYANYGSKDSTIALNGVSIIRSYTLEPTIQTVRAGLTYKFAAPVAAK